MTTITPEPDDNPEASRASTPKPAGTPASENRPTSTPNPLAEEPVGPLVDTGGTVKKQSFLDKVASIFRKN